MRIRIRLDNRLWLPLVSSRKAPKIFWKISGRTLSTVPTKKPKWKVAVILSGCGVFDGTEIHEAAATLVHLSRRSMKPLLYAPCAMQNDVINHSTGEKSNEMRSVLVESARIARGSVTPLHDLKSRDADALVFPGGFGVAKNLSNFATASASCTLNLDVCRVIQDFQLSKKPMAFMCIAPVLAARIIPNVRITLGSKGLCYGQNPEDWPHSSAIDAAMIMGAKLEIQDVYGIAVDKENLIVSTPAFMYNGEYHEIFAGIGKLIEHLECLLKVTTNTE